jgi:hypothetical protein
VRRVALQPLPMEANPLPNTRTGYSETISESPF